MEGLCAESRVFNGLALLNASRAGWHSHRTDASLLGFPVDVSLWYRRAVQAGNPVGRSMRGVLEEVAAVVTGVDVRPIASGDSSEGGLH